MKLEITVTNPTLSRKWGWEYSTQPERNSTSIVPPTKPYYTGTLRQVREAIEKDSTFASVQSGNTYYASRWFYDGKPILGIDGAWGDTFHDWLYELDFEKSEGRTPASVTLTVEVTEEYAAARRLGSIRSESKAAAARENGKAGGRPRKA
jgi:hypothetical protein